MNRTEHSTGVGTHYPPHGVDPDESENMTLMNEKISLLQETISQQQKLLDEAITRDGLLKKQVSVLARGLMEKEIQIVNMQAEFDLERQQSSKCIDDLKDQVISMSSSIDLEKKLTYANMLTTVFNVVCSTVGMFLGFRYLYIKNFGAA